MTRTGLCLFFAASWITATAPAAETSTAPDKATGPQERTLQHMLVINEDNSHFFGSRKPEDMTRAGLHAFVDQYAESAVTHLFLCPNAMRASFRSSSRDAIWDPVGGKVPTHIWPQNASPVKVLMG